jgi:hypothetical protein
MRSNINFYVFKGLQIIAWIIFIGLCIEAGALLLQKMNLSNPFSAYVSEQITKVSYCTFSIGLINYFAVSTSRNLVHKGYNIDQLNSFWVNTEAFILMAAIINVISIIFKRGVELQQENELTV